MIPITSQHLDPKNWSLPTKEDSIKYYKDKAQKKEDSKNKKNGSILLFQKHLSPVDVYCYLKACFGNPNGIINHFKSPTSENYIHWEYLLKCNDTYINVMGISRSVQIIIEEKLDDDNWCTLVHNFRNEFSKKGIKKSEILGDLEEWIEFINRYSELCDEAAIHYEKVRELKDFKFELFDYPEKREETDAWQKDFEEKAALFTDLKQSALVLKMITPIMLEAFINLIILIMCKREIRNNKAIYEARIREELHIKVPSLHITCNHFDKPIDNNSPEYKFFSKIMNGRNLFFHGNANPEKDKLEILYFERNTPLYKTAGNLHERFFNKLLEMIKPEEIIDDYIKAHEFIIYVVSCIKESFQDQTWIMLDARTLGYNKKEDRYGVLFGDMIATGYLPGIPTDKNIFP